MYQTKSSYHSQGRLSYPDYVAQMIEEHYIQGFYDGLNHDWIMGIYLKRLISRLDSEWIRMKENTYSTVVLTDYLPGCAVSIRLKGQCA